MRIEVTIKFFDLPRNPKWARDEEPNPKESFPTLKRPQIFARKVWEIIAGDIELLTCRIKSDIDDLNIRCFIDDEEQDY